MPNDHPLIDTRHLDVLEPSAARSLLVRTAADDHPPPERRVFVNRNLRMEKIRFIGFDLDWTLADYARDAISRLAFERTLKRLVERHGYPKKILDAEMRADFARRGLMIDKEAGMVLKMNRHRYVGRAYHGRHALGRDERAELYRREPINPGSPRFYLVDTLFELPEVDIFSEVVEMSRQGTGGVELPSYDQLFTDIRTAIDTIHADGSLKRDILAEPDRFLRQDPELPLAMERFALGGRRLLLITNSEWYYTDALMHHLFGPEILCGRPWRELFDLVVVDAKKPGFFRKTAPFVELDAAGKPGTETAVPAWGKVYSGGSREGLMKLLDAPGEQMLYIGDHIYGDVVSSKLATTWRTVLVVGELDDELRVRQKLATDLKHLDQKREELITLGQRMDNLRDLDTLYRKAAVNGRQPVDIPALTPVHELLSELREEHRIMRRHAERLARRVSKAINPYWGSLFKQFDSKSFFGDQVGDFACLYTSRVSNFAAYGSEHYFRVRRDAMAHEADL